MSRKLALLIANSEYQDPILRRLAAPPVDAERLTQVLKAPEIGGFDDVRSLVNQPEGALRREIEGFFDQGRKDDLLLLYFSGHGVLDKHWGQLHFAVHDTRPTSSYATAVPATFIRQMMISASPGDRC
jgi:hypothetical protein